MKTIYVIVILCLVNNIIYANNEITGKKLPPFVKNAVNILNEVPSVKKDHGKISVEQIVIVQNIDLFCVTNLCAEQDLNKLRTAEAFVRIGKFPVYIVAEKSKYTRYSFWEAEYENSLESEEFPCKYPDAVYILAALIGHELIHTKGILDEAPAYRSQEEYLKHFTDKGCLSSPESKIAIKRIEQLRTFHGV